jgi:raffinose/stachyose/melibiose transport system permease protein
MKRGRNVKYAVSTFITLALTFLVFGIPLYFIIINSFKDRRSAGLLSIDLPKIWQIFENYSEVVRDQNYMLIRAFFNSTLLTILTLIVLVIVCSMGAYVLQRRRSRHMGILNSLILMGLMIPPSIMTTIWIMRGIGIYKSLFGMVMVESALNISFMTVLYRGFIGSVPREIEEAAFVDGCGRLRMFFSIVFPLLKPITATIAVLGTIIVFNDFVNPLYFLPGAKNATVQLTLYNYMGKFSNYWNLLFADVVLISIPPFILFLLFRKQIMTGMTLGAVKG